MIIEEIDRELLCDMTEEEQRLRGIELAELTAQFKELEAEKKAAAKEYGDRIKAMREKLESLSKDVESCTEKRRVACHIEGEIRSGEVQIRRLDTREVVETRDATAKEMQLMNRRVQGSFPGLDGPTAH
ncbi:MAG: hypothetical protein ACE366_16785 [Bradymonadia bacterium]